MRALCFLGETHAARHLAEAAWWRGFRRTNLHDADLVFVSVDTPIEAGGVRDHRVVRELVESAWRSTSAPIVLTSQVEPGFCRSLDAAVWHQVDTLRILDAEKRARHPEQMIVGSALGNEQIPPAYAEYLAAWECPLLRMTWEEAELAKIAINIFLIGQVDATNRLSAIASRLGADWTAVREALQNDARIGPFAYLQPGNWQDSMHMVRDAVSLLHIEQLGESRLK